MYMLPRGKMSLVVNYVCVVLWRQTVLLSF